MITRSTAVVGSTASPLTPEPLFRIAVDNEIELEAEVPSIHVPALTSGDRSRRDRGRARAVRARSPRPRQDRSTYPTRPRPHALERDPLIRLGIFARATIDAQRSCAAYRCPRSAVRYRTEGTSVQVVRNDAIETRLVQVGLHSDTDTEIRDGLREGDMVVANAGSLRDGDKVKPIIADTARTGSADAGHSDAGSTAQTLVGMGCSANTSSPSSG